MITDNDFTSSVIFDDSCLACWLGQNAALTVHRTVIHYRVPRFATSKGKAWFVLIRRLPLEGKLDAKQTDEVTGKETGDGSVS